MLSAARRAWARVKRNASETLDAIALRDATRELDDATAAWVAVEQARPTPSASSSASAARKARAEH